MKNDTKKTADLPLRVERFARDCGLYSQGSRLLVALSGGKDSVCLLRVLAEQRQRLGLELFAAHVHHGLRESAERDLDFCRSLCESLGVELHVCRVDAAAVAKERKMGVEEAGRALRYEYFAQVQAQLGAHRVLTAHTASDQCETVLMRLVRGSALRGLCGIPVKRGSIVRPLLCVTSEEVVAYLRLLGQDWVEDETNGSEAYCRNRFRRQILPLIKQENPAWEATVWENSLALRKDSELLEALCRRVLEPIGTGDGLCIDRKALQGLCTEAGMEGLFGHAVARAVQSLGIPMPSAERVEALRRGALEGQAGKCYQFPSGVMSVEQGEILFSREGEGVTEPYERAISAGEACFLPTGAKIRCKLPEKSENYKNINKMLMIMKINSATISGGLVARSRRAEDRIEINGMKKSVKKLLCDLKLPNRLRRQIPVIADDEGIVWVPGVGLCDRARPREGEAFFTMEFHFQGIG